MSQLSLFADQPCFWLVSCVYERGWRVASSEDAARAFLQGRKVMLVTADDLIELLKGQAA